MPCGRWTTHLDPGVAPEAADDAADLIHDELPLRPLGLHVDLALGHKGLHVEGEELAHHLHVLGELDHAGVLLGAEGAEVGVDHEQAVT